MTTIIRSVKLTDALRREISSELMKDKFAPELDKMYAQAAELAVSAYNRFYKNVSEVEKTDVPRKMRELPPGWLPELDAIVVRFVSASRGENVKLHFNGFSRFLPWKDNSTFEGGLPPDAKLRFRQVDTYLSPHLTVEKSDPLSAVYNEMVSRILVIERETERLKKDISGVLYSATTTGRLTTLWPEIEPIVKKLAPVETAAAKLPAKVLTGLNERLGLGRKAA